MCGSLTATQPARRLSRLLPASYAAIDALCAQVRALLVDNYLWSHAFAVQLLLREALVNAVKHGSDGDSGKTIACDIRLTRAWILLRVVDPGPGFDWRRQLGRRIDELRETGRGLMTYALYADRVLFNPQGNRLVLARRIERPIGEE